MKFPFLIFKSSENLPFLFEVHVSYPVEVYK